MAGLLSFLGGGQAQVPGQNRFGNAMNNLLDPQIALPMAAQLMGQNGNMQNFGNAFAAAAPAFQQRNELKAQTAQKNQTLDFFRKNAPDYYEMVQAGMPVKDAWTQYVKNREAQTPSAPSYSKTPVYGTDADGNTVLGTIGDDGSFKKIDTGDFNVSAGFEKIDTGTEIILRDKRSGQVVDVTPKQNYQERYDQALGAEEGKAKAEQRSQLSTQSAAAQNAIRLVDSILEHPSLDAAVGPIQGQLPSFRAGTRDFDERVEQLKGQAFLQARQELKGGGQITDYEGQRAENALVRASQAKSEEDFKAAMMEFRDAIVRGYQILEQQAGGAPSGAPIGGSSTGRTSSGIQWSID